MSIVDYLILYKRCKRCRNLPPILDDINQNILQADNLIGAVNSRNSKFLFCWVNEPNITAKKSSSSKILPSYTQVFLFNKQNPNGQIKKV